MLKQLLEGIKAFIMGGDLPTPEESRQTPRVLCQYRANVRAGKDEYQASVVDIGATGIGLEGGPKLKKGQQIQISYPMAREFVEENAVHLEVMWSRVREHDKQVLVGARYTDDLESLKRSWVFVLLEELGLYGDSTFQKRKYARLASAMKADLRDYDTGRHLTRGKVANLSLGGALIESEDKVKSGTKLLVLMGPHIDYPPSPFTGD